MAVKRLNSNMVGAGDVSNTEHAYLNSISSNVQTQITGNNLPAVGSSGNVLTSDGTNWASAAAGAGKIVQAVNVTDHTLSTTTATIPQDNTTPQNTEGLELFTLAITPTSASNKLLILADVNMANTGAIITRIVALFQDSTAGALAVTGTASDTNNPN